VPGEALGDVEHETINRSYVAVLAEIQKIVDIGDRDEIQICCSKQLRALSQLKRHGFSNRPPDLMVFFTRAAFAI
jgi:hypothetical protein